MSIALLKSFIRRRQAEKRQRRYAAFLADRNQRPTLQEIVGFGHRLMRRARLHPHFFSGNSLHKTALYLAFYHLKLPHDPADPRHLAMTLSTEDATRILALFEKRIAERLPVEYITNESRYEGNAFYVTPDVLVPRSLMSARFKDFLNDMHWENYRVLDLCTGSGCIGITLALLDPRLKVDLADISEKALAVANINVRMHGLQDRVTCIQSDLFENINQRYDLIITNPPYATTAEYLACPPEFKNEPRMAIESGRKGLDIIHRILGSARHYLNPRGKLIAEVGFTAAKRLKKTWRKTPFQWFKYRRPCGKESLFGMHGVFVCEAKGLPGHEQSLA